MGSQNIAHAYVPKKGNNKGAQRQSTIKYTLNEDLAKESHAHEEYIQSFKHTKDIRDQMNSEQNIITWKKQELSKVKRHHLASTRANMGQHNNNFNGKRAKEERYAGAYTPNAGINRKLVENRASTDQGSPIKYKPYEQTKIAGLPGSFHPSKKNQNHELWNKDAEAINF